MLRLMVIGTIVLMCVVSLAGCRQAAKQHDQKVAATPYRTDVQPILRRLPKLVGITKCYWKAGEFFDDRSVPGPGTYWMKGFVLLTASEAMRIGKAYQWDDTPAGWKPSLDISVSGLKPAKWVMSLDYADAIKKSDSIGFDIYFDESNSLIFFDMFL